MQKAVRGILKDSPEFFTQHIAFYLDGITFVHKYNPMNEAEKLKARIWRKKGEGLCVTTKGTKELAGGRRLHLMVAVAYGKDVVLCQPYEMLNTSILLLGRQDQKLKVKEFMPNMKYCRKIQCTCHMHLP